MPIWGRKKRKDKKKRRRRREKKWDGLGLIAEFDLLVGLEVL